MKMKPQTGGKKYLDDRVKMCDESTAGLELSTFISGCEFMVVLVIKKCLDGDLNTSGMGRCPSGGPYSHASLNPAPGMVGASSLPPVRGQGRLGLAYAQAYVAEFEPVCI